MNVGDVRTLGSGEAAVEAAADLRFNAVRARGSPIARSGTSRTASDRWQVADVFRPLIGRTSGRRSGCRGSRRSPASTRALLLVAARRWRGAARTPVLARGARASLAAVLARAGRDLRRRAAAGARPAARRRWLGPGPRRAAA